MNSKPTDARLSGLTEREAASRLATDGPNVLPMERRRSAFRLLLGVAREPMVVLLLAAAAAYVVLGDPPEALTLLASVVLVIVITVTQEARTERALGALRDLSSPRAQVLRDGQARTVPARELVRGDVIRIAEGDRVPADALLRAGTALSVDESLLTGESAPVTKRPSVEAVVEVPGSEGTGSLFSGTLVTAGRGIAEVAATGSRSELGRIGTSLESLEVARTPLQREVDVLVRRVAVIALALALLVGLASGFSGRRWVDAILSGLTVAIALVPEEFPVVLTVFLALGAWRISRNRVLTRRVAVLETLGAVDVLCTDKTGTLTQNKMSIRRLCTGAATFAVDEASSELPEDVHALVEFGVLACPRDPFDPMEKAFLEVGHRTLTGTEHLHPRWAPVREYPLSPELLAVTHVWSASERESLVVATKGAPEAIFDLCHLSSADAVQWRERAAVMARDGLRVLGVARSRGALHDFPERAHDIEFDMVGLVGMEDPLRSDVVDAVALCKRAQIRVVMITGDHPETARAIARAAGIDAGGILVGADVDRMDDGELSVALTKTSVIARAVPAHKLRIVRSLRGRGLVVGMTGDGVNDAPALKAADVGIAMGARGTEVAREAASLVLVDDDFGAIVEAVRSGRRIYDNLRKAFGYIVAVHIPIAGLSVVPALLGWASIVLPVHVVFLELIIDPACSIVFEMEPEESNLMGNPPRSHEAHLLDARKILWSALIGTACLCGTLWSLTAAREAGRAVGVQRALAFVSLVTGNLSILVASRSFGRPSWASIRRWNPALPVLCLAAIAVLVVVVGVPVVRAFFDFELGTSKELFRAVFAAAAPVLAVACLRPRIASH